MKSILFLPSWYPDKEFPLDGNFIQRHAELASERNTIVVLSVKGHEMDYRESTVEINERLTEYRIHFKKSALPWLRPFQYFKYYRRGYKNVVAKHGQPDMVHVHVTWFAGLFAAYLKMAHGIPYIITEHWSMLLAENQKNLSKIKRGLMVKLLKGARRTTAVSPHLAMDIGEMANIKVGVLSNVIHERFFTADSTQKFPVFSFICISNFAPVKQTPAIVKAFTEALKQGIQAQLLLIGEEGPDKAVCRDLAATNQHITILDQTDVSGITKLLAQCHVLVSFSIFETQGITVLEALAMGIPVITSRIAPFTKYIDAEKGLLADNASDLTQKMVELYTHYQRYRPDSIRNWCSQHYSSESILNTFDDLYQA